MRIMIPFLLPVLLLIACNNGKNVNNKDTTTAKSQHDVSANDKVPYADSVTGNQVFHSTCNACHRDASGLQAPSPEVLSLMTPRAIFSALKNGKMKQQAAKLDDKQRKAVAEWITNAVFKENTLSKDAYTSFAITGNEPIHSGWGGNLEGTGLYTAEQTGINADNVSSLQLKWAFAFPDATQVRSRPAITGDWLIVGSQYGDVYAINKQTGKIGWTFVADAAVRGAIQLSREGDNITAYFADFSANAYALDVTTGRLLWKQRAGINPQSSVTGSVTVYDGEVYVPLSSIEVVAVLNPDYKCCTSSGGVVALDAKTGNPIWQHRVVTAEAKISGKKKNGKPFYGPSGAPVWNSPTVDTTRGLLYIGTGENYTYPTTATSDAIQALDLKTGRVVWNFQATKGDAWNVSCPDGVNCPSPVGPDLDFGMAPLLVRRKDGKEVLVVGEKSGVVYSLSPGDGKLLWQTRIGKGGALGGIHWGMATDGMNVYAANADNTSDIASYYHDTLYKPSPGIYALDLQTGKVVWKASAPPCDTSRKGCLVANSAAPIVIPGVVFAGALDGHIRAYSTTDGKLLWEYDTVKDFDAVNGIKGRGGALDGAAPVVSDGMLFVNSGYAFFGEMPGNVLLAFEVK